MNVRIPIKPEEAEGMIGKAVTLWDIDIFGDSRRRLINGIGVVIDIIRTPFNKGVEFIVKSHPSYEQISLENVGQIDLKFWQERWADELKFILDLHRKDGRNFDIVDKSIKYTGFEEVEKMIGKPVFVNDVQLTVGVGIVVDIFGWFGKYLVGYDFPHIDNVGLAIITSDIIYPIDLDKIEAIDLKSEQEMVKKIKESFGS